MAASATTTARTSTPRTSSRSGARRLIKVAAKRGGGVDVLLTHAPPRGLGDGDDLPHHGFEALHEVHRDACSPTWHLHGHIHPYGQPQPDREVGSTTIRNVVPYKLDSRSSRRSTRSGRSWLTPGSPRIDAESDFLRARRLQTLSALAGAAARRRRRGHVRALSFDEVVDALGRRGERRIGLHLIPLDAIIGSVDKVRDFDRRFRPTSDRSRARWERIARASRVGEEIPPIDVYKLGDYYFVRDGHHRVSVARALRLRLIEAEVTEVADAARAARHRPPRRPRAEALAQAVPPARAARRRRCAAGCASPTPHGYGMLAEMVEAWAARTMQAEGELHGQADDGPALVWTRSSSRSSS